MRAILSEAYNYEIGVSFLKVIKLTFSLNWGAYLDL